MSKEKGIPNPETSGRELKPEKGESIGLWARSMGQEKGERNTELATRNV